MVDITAILLVFKLVVFPKTIGTISAVTSIKTFAVWILDTACHQQQLQNVYRVRSLQAESVMTSFYPVSETFVSSWRRTVKRCVGSIVMLNI